MGVLDRFEKGIERAVNGAFAKAFRSEVQPVEIASALRREVDDRATIVSRDRTLAPNTFVVELGAADHGRLGEWEETLAQELTQAVQGHAEQQRYVFVGPVTVVFEEAEDLDTGVFRVRSATHRGVAAPAAPVAPAPDLQLSQPPAPVQPPAPAPEAPPMPAAPPAATPSALGVASLEVDGRPHRLSTAVTVIGRSTEADVMIDDAGVSRRHAEVHVIDGRARVIDLGSTNGTFVDGERVHARELADGSIITIGRSRIVYHTGQR